ncbi:MAG: S8 family serine peptidase [Betaproteobacteria bacterium]
MTTRRLVALLFGAASALAGAAAAQAPAIKSPPAQPVLVGQMIVKLRAAGVDSDRVSGMSAERARRLSSAVGQSLTPLRAMSGEAAVLRLAQPLAAADAQQLAQALARDPAVEWAAPDLPVKRLQSSPPDANFPTRQWNLLPANAQFVSASLVTPASTVNFSATGGANGPLAWSITRGSAAVRVAVIDTGVHLSHPDLVANLLPGYDFISADALAVAPFNAPLHFVANDGNGRDPDAGDPGDWVTAEEAAAYPILCGAGDVGPSTWHGTSMAGLIAALWTAANPNPPGTSLAGLAPEARIVPVRALGKCGGTTADVIDAIRWSAGLAVPGVPLNPNPARLISLSLGTAAGACNAAYQSAVNDVLAAGAAVVAASGNDAANAVSQPANCAGVIGVTAHAINGDNATYANIGPEVALSAPGGGRPSLAALAPLDADQTAYYVWAPSLFGATTPASAAGSGDARSGPATGGLTGTSAAAAQVAAAAALLWSVDPSLAGPQLRAFLTSTARAHPAAGYCATEPTAQNRCGAGLLDAGAAVDAVYRAQQQQRRGDGGGGALPLAALLLVPLLGAAGRLRRASAGGAVLMS